MFIGQLLHESDQILWWSHNVSSDLDKTVEDWRLYCHSLHKETPSLPLTCVPNRQLYKVTTDGTDKVRSEVPLPLSVIVK